MNEHNSCPIRLFRDASLLLTLHAEHLKLGFGVQILTFDQYLLRFIHSDLVPVTYSAFLIKLYYCYL